jgi:protein ImuB
VDMALGMAFAAIYVPEFMVQAVVRAVVRPVVCAETGSSVGSALHARAIALVDQNPPLWNVMAATKRALAAGIVLGMTKANALQFAGVEIRARSLAAEKVAHAALRDVGWSISPRLEETAPDLMILDLAGLSSLLGSEETIANLLISRAEECGLCVNVAIAENLLAAEIAARGFIGITLIEAGQEASRIGKLPVSVLSPSEEIAETLRLWGIQNCAALARLPIPQLSERLGQPGVHLRTLARGTALRALIIAEPDLIFEEEMELDDAVEELEPLSFVLGRLLNQLCVRLTARALAASLLRVRFDLQPAFENALDVRTEVVRAKNLPGIYEHVMQLPVPMRDPKLLLKLLRLRLQGSPPGAPIVKVLVAAEAAQPRGVQRSFFLPRHPDVEKLELTLTRLAGVVGEGNVGSAEVLDTHRPGEFSMQKFAPVREEPAKSPAKRSTNRNSLPKREGHFAGNAAALSFRVFRPPLPITVKSPKGRPAEIFLQGRRGEVQTASGPWRTSGAWWREDQWIEDEWDLEVRFTVRNNAPSKIPGASKIYDTPKVYGTPKIVRPEYWPEKTESNKKPIAEYGRYRIYFDAVRQSWFARGMYD